MTKLGEVGVQLSLDDPPKLLLTIGSVNLSCAASTTAPAGPVMAPAPAGMIGRLLKGAPPSGALRQPQMAPAPITSAARPLEPRLKKDRGLEM
jgi:hypothetical protein